MLRQITGTIAARVSVTALNLAVTMLAGHRLGASGLGIISLVVLGITLLMLAANLVGGGALVYLVPRVPLRRLLVPAYAWSVAACAAGYAVLRLFRLVPDGYEVHVALLSLLQAVYSIHLSVLIGQQRIRTHNGILIAQAVVLLAAFLLLLRDPQAEAMAYVQASYAAFGGTVLLSALAMRDRAPTLMHDGTGVLRILVRQGLLVQSANGMQLLNYRLAYWLIERFRGTAALGLYGVGNQLAESAWLAPKSLGLVLYSRVSNTAGMEQQRLLTLTILKVSLACASAVVVVLLLVPDVVFRWAFGPQITGLFPIIALLAPGIIAMAASQAFSHFFSGTGRNKHNVIGSGLGLIVTLGVGYRLIPAEGLLGAACTASLAYLLNAVYQAVVFTRLVEVHWRELLPGRADVERLRQLAGRLRGRS